MQDWKDTVAHILAMQILVAAVLVDRWAAGE